MCVRGGRGGGLSEREREREREERETLSADEHNTIWMLTRTKRLQHKHNCSPEGDCEAIESCDQNSCYAQI